MSRLTRLTLLAVLLLCFASPLAPHSSAHATPAAEYVPGQLVAKVNPARGDVSLVNALYGTATLKALPGLGPVYLLQAPAGADPVQLVQAMAADPLLEYAELNYTHEPPDVHTDRIYAWGGEDEAPVHVQYAVEALRLAEAHAVTRGAGSLIAVLDTGVQPDHPALASVLSPLGYDFADDDPWPYDEGNDLDDDEDGQIDEAVGHGTHVAGIAHLVAPEATILPLRVLNSDGRGDNFRTAAALLYAASHGADVANMSLGSPHASALMQDAIDHVAAQGVVVVAAAGNSNTDTRQYPASDACALAVTATEERDRKADFANYGDWVGIAAPGESIYSTAPTDGYAWWSGTSMATPFVAGQVALLRDVDAALSVQAIGAWIGGTAQPVRGPRADQMGAGLSDAGTSVTALAAGGPAPAGANPLAGCGAN